MANGGGFEGGVGAVDAKLREIAAHSKDIARNLERASSSFGSFGKAADRLDVKMNDIARKMERLNELGDKSGFEKLGKQLTNINMFQKAFKGLNLIDKGLTKVVDGFIKLGGGVVATTFNFLISGIKRVYELQERWTRAMGGFNMKLGGMTAGLRQAQRAATQWSSTIRGLTDGDITEGIQMFEEFTYAMSRVIRQGDDFSKFGIQLARGFNLGGQGAGRLASTFEDMGMSARDSIKVMSELIDAANLVDVPVNQLAQDVSEANVYMARFGKEGARGFVTAAAYARKFAMSMRDLQAATEKFDMFDDAATTASKLNSTFGTLINSVDLMLMDDPAQRIEYLRQAFLAQGKTFDTLSIKERRFAAETMGVNDQQLATLLSLKEANMSYQDLVVKQQAQEQSEAKAKKQMEVQLRKTAQTMYAFGAAFDRITVAIAKAIRPLLEVLGLAKSGQKDFKSFGQVMESITQHVIHFFESLAGNDKWQMLMRKLAGGMREVGAAIGSFIMSGKAAQWAGKLAEFMSDIYDYGRKAFSFMIDAAKRLEGPMRFLVGHFKEIAIAWAVMRGAGAVANMGTNFALGGGPRNGMPVWSDSRVMMGQRGAGGGGGGASAGGINWATSTGDPFNEMTFGNTPGKKTRGQRALGRLRMGGMAGFAAAGITSLIGGNVGGAVGSSLGSGIGAMFAGPFGMAVGGALGGFVGQKLGGYISGLFAGKKSEVEKSRENLRDAMDDMAEQAKRHASINEAMDARIMLQDSKRAALSSRLRSIDEKAASTKGRMNELSSSELSDIQVRLIEMKKFGMSTKGLSEILSKSLAPGAQLTDQEIRKVLKASSAYEAELQKLRDTTQKHFEQEQLRLQGSRAAIEAKQMEMRAKEMEVQLKAEQTLLKDIKSGRIEKDFSYERDAEFRKFADSKAAKFKGGAGLNISYKNFGEDMKRSVNREFAIQKQKQRVNNLEIDVNEMKEKAVRAGMDLDKKLFIMQARHLIMQDTRFLELQKTMSSINATPSQVLAAFLHRNQQEFRGLYGSDFDSLVTGDVRPMASGGIVRRPTRALIGENGPEAVVPLRAIARSTGPVSRKLGGSFGRKVANMASGGSGGGTTTVQVVTSDVYIDGTKAGRAITKVALSSPE